MTGRGVTIGAACVVSLATAAGAGDDRAAPAFLKPFGMAVDDAGLIYVADIDANHVVVLDDTLTVRRTIARVEDYGPLSRPFDVAIHGDRFFLLDVGRSNLLIVDSKWNLLHRVGTDTPGNAHGQFSEPHALTVSPNGTVYVADTMNHRVEKFDRDGNYLGTIAGGAIGGSFPIDYPAGIAALSNDRFVVSEYGDHPPLIMDSTGRMEKVLQPLGLAYGVAANADRFAVVATYNNTVDVYDHAGNRLRRLHSATDSSAPGAFNKPGGAALMADGRLLVGEWRNHRVQMFDAEGAYLTGRGGFEAMTGRNYEPTPHRFSSAPVLLAAFTRVMTPAQIAQYHTAGVGKLYVQPGEDLQSDALRDAVQAAHALGMKIDIVFDTYMFGARPGPEGDMSRFARENKAFFTRKRDGVTANREMLSYAYPEVRAWKARQVVESFKHCGADGVVLDYIRWPAGNTDGYDPPALEAFGERYGEDAREVDPLDPRWVELRAGYITLFITELRDALRSEGFDVPIGVYVDADPAAELRGVGRNWPAWSSLGVIDGTHHMLYTADFDALYHGVRAGLAHTTAQTRVVSCIDVYAGFLSTPELLREGARVSALAGANEIVVVRDGTIERLDLFDALRQIADDLEAFNAPMTGYDCRYTREPITLDGRLDEPAWRDAARVDTFRLFRPTDARYGARTSGRLLWDEQYLYAAFTCEDDDVRAASDEHDALLAAGDVVELYVKRGDAPQYYELVVAPNGTTFDARWPYRGAGDYRQFTPWESGMAVATHIDGTLNRKDDVDHGYTVEMRIPWSAFDGAVAPRAGDVGWTFGMFRYDHGSRMSQPRLLMSLPTAEHAFHSYESYHPLRFTRDKEHE